MAQPANDIIGFLSGYDEQVAGNAFRLRELLLKLLPEVSEQLDLPAKMVAYCYGRKYSQLVCVIIPSKKGLKLGFNKGPELPDPEGLLEGTGKISRYVEIRDAKQVNSAALKNLVKAAYKAYQKRMG
jgi:hypothetical protein